MIKILIVEDDPDILQLVEFLLNEAGFTIKGLINGDGFLEEAVNFSPDLVLMDITLPKHDGRLLSKELKAHTQTQNIKVVLFSAMHRQEVALQDSAADAF